MSWTKSFEKDAGLSNNAIIDTRGIGAKFVDGEIVLEETGSQEPATVPAPAAEPVPEPEKKPASKLVDELDRIEAAWLEQLSHIRHNTEIIEAKIKSCVVALRQDMARLDLLADQARKEAQRGVKVARHFAASLDQIKGGR
jgi:hypothetical protein